MSSKHIIYLFFMLCMGTVFSQQRIKNINIEIEYYPEKEISLVFFGSSDDLYQLNLISGKHRDLDFQFKIRMEDELTSEEAYKLLSDVAFFDLQVSYEIGAFGMSWAIENLFNFNNPAFAIEGSIERSSGGIDTVYYTHEADFMLSTALSYNF